MKNDIDGRRSLQGRHITRTIEFLVAILADGAVPEQNCAGDSGCVPRALYDVPTGLVPDMTLVSTDMSPLTGFGCVVGLNLVLMINPGVNIGAGRE